MVSRSPSTPSEGEIVESDSEKATTSLRMINGTKVDRQSRICVSVSPSPSPYQSPRRQLSRTPSRSPYRESRGPKRRREDDHYNDRSRNDPRHFNVRYENRLGHGKVSRNTYDDLDRSRDSNPSLRYEDRAPYGRIRDKRPHTRSRSPYRPKSDVFDRGNYGRNEREGKGNKRIRVEPSGNGYRESSRGLSIEQSVSDRGQPPIATTTLRRDAENRFNQTQHASRPNQNTGHSVDEYVPCLLFKFC